MLDYVLGSFQKNMRSLQDRRSRREQVRSAQVQQGTQSERAVGAVGVERESGKTFLVPVPHRTADTLMAVLRDWIEPGTTVINDCWSAYCDIGTHGYRHKSTTRSNSLIWVLGLIRTRSRASGGMQGIPQSLQLDGDYIYYLVHYMFAAGGRSENVDQFTKFIGIVARMNWSATPTLQRGHVAKGLTDSALHVNIHRPRQVRSVTSHII